MTAASDTRQRILAVLFEALEAGRELDSAELEARFPGRAELVASLQADVRSYASLRSSLRAPGSALPELAPGTLLGDFELESPLARGGMGVVHRARQRSLGGRLVALKVAAIEAEDERGLARFRREALALADLHHPHLAEVYGFGVEGDLAFFAMRLVEGPCLTGLLGRGEPARTGVELRRRVELARQVASALAAVHGRGLLHRDVKPANVVLERAHAGGPEKAVLVDFGLVQRFAARAGTLTRASPGTPEYASPEQLLGLELDPRTDVFGLGATLHDLLTGRASSERPQASAGMEPLQRLVPAVDRDLAAVVARAVDPEWHWRYEHAGELEQELASWIAGRGVRARRAPLARRLTRWIGRHPRVLGLGAGSVIALALTGWCASTFALWRRAAADVERGFDAGDPAEIEAGFAALPGGLLGRWLLGNDAALDVARDLARGAPGAVRKDLGAALRESGPDAALCRAAVHLRVEGPGRDPFIDRFFLGGLLDSAPWQRPRLHLQAAILLGRVFYERPLESPRELALGSAFRERALALLAATDLADEGRPYLFTALSGCGYPADADTLLEEGLRPGAGREERRLAFQCVERIVRRALSSGLASELDLDGLERGALPFTVLLVDEAPGATDPARADLVRAVIELWTALTFARRALGEPVPAEPRLDLSSAAGAEPTWEVLQLLAARADPRLRTLLASGPPMGPFLRRSVSAWGWACGAAGDAELAALARARCEDRPSSWRMTEFEAGFEAGAARRRGVDSDEDLNPETLLGAAPPPDSDLLLRTEGTASHEARWTVVAEEMHAAGWRSELELRGGVFHDDRVELFDFGKSTLRIAVEVPLEAVHEGLELELDQQIGARVYLPCMGRAELELRCNGALVEARVLRQITRSALTFFVPASLLRGPAEDGTARQSLALRLLDSTLTPWWLHTMTLRAR